MKKLHNPKSFARVIRKTIKTRGVDQKTMAKEAGIHNSTVCRVLKGKGPDVEGYLRVLNWLYGDYYTIIRKAKP